MADHACCAPGRSGAVELSPPGAIATGSLEVPKVQIDTGSFLMGTEDRDGFAADGEGPVREVTLDTYQIGVTAVTNEQFAAFVDDTGYVTEAERFGWSFVFAASCPPRSAR